jgi:predicted RecB family nuclease
MATRKASSPRAEKLPSVSAIINRFKESGALIGWAYKMGKEGRDLRAARELTVGVIVEQMIEAHLLGQAAPAPPSEATAADVERARVAFSGFASWATANEVELLERQVEFTSHAHRFTGRVDALIRLRGERVIADWKVTSGVFLDHLLQLAAYRIALRGLDGDAAPKRAALIHISKDAGLVTPHEWDDETLSTAEQMFLTLRAAWDLDKALKPIFKAA